jgi:peroxiredoxin
MQEKLPDFEQAGASLIAISPDSQENLDGMAQAKGITFPLLSDSAMAVIDSYRLGYHLSDALNELYQGFGNDLAQRNHQTSAQLPVPASYVIDTDGLVHYAFIEEDHTVRAEPTVLLEEVRKLGAQQP